MADMALPSIDWTLLARIAGPVLGAAVGVVLSRAIERRPRLITYLGHTSAFNVTGQPGQQPIQVHTHSIVVRNSGRRPATNVRVAHHVLPDYQLFPPVVHRVEMLPGGGAELVFPTLVPDEQISISYLYFPPLLWSHVHIHTKSDEGFARVLHVLPTPQYPRWQVRFLQVLVLLGAVSVLYILTEVLLRLIR